MNCVCEIYHTWRWRRRTGSRWGWWPSSSSKYFHGLSQGILRTIKKPIPIRESFSEKFLWEIFCKKNFRRMFIPSAWPYTWPTATQTVPVVVSPMVMSIHGFFCALSLDMPISGQPIPIPSQSWEGQTVSSLSWQSTGIMGDPLQALWPSPSAIVGSAPQRFKLCHPQDNHNTLYMRSGSLLSSFTPHPLQLTTNLYKASHIASWAVLWHLWSLCCALLFSASDRIVKYLIIARSSPWSPS